MRSPLLILAAVVILAAGFFSFSQQGLSQAQSAAATLRGYGWSDTIGWISFSSRNCDANENGLFDESEPEGCPTSGTAYPYGVSKGSNNVLTGYAWSEHIGWISFGQLSGCPIGPCQAHMEGNRMKGWAKALSADNKGWDGWISLGTQNNQTVEYGAIGTGSGDTTTFDGYAWGSDVVGWVDMGLVSMVKDDDQLCGSSHRGTFASTPTANLCADGATLSGTVFATPVSYSWRCVSGAASSMCSATRENGGPVPVDAQCSSEVNQCLPGTFSDLPDTPTQARWNCLGQNGGMNATCSRTFNAPAACTPIISAAQPRTLVDTPQEKCPISWTVTYAEGAAACATAITTCQLDGAAASPYSGEISVGTHNISCTSTINGQSRTATLSPKPQCRLNPNFGEF